VPPGYGYGNARLRAMRSRLLTEVNYKDLLAKVKIEEVITALTETPYKEDVEVALVRVGGARCVIEALRANLTRTLRQIRDFFEGDPQALVDVLLRHWDRHNLLTILRGQSQEVPPETVLSAIIPVGQLDEVSLREMACQPGLKATIDLMDTWGLPYADVLHSVPARIGTIPDLDQLEMALNRFHYVSLRKTLSQGSGNHMMVAEHLEAEIDLVNICTALRLVRLPGAPTLVRQRYNANGVSRMFIEPGGDLRTGRLVQLVSEAGGLEGVVRGLNGTRYGLALEAGWKRYKSGEGNVAVLERELERWQAERTAAMFTRNSLSIAIPIGYLGCKQVEVANLRLIALAVALDLKREQVRRNLILV
jgi:ATP synthase A1 C subunit